MPSKNVVELDWWDRHAICEGITATYVPAEHFSGRGLFDRDKSLWGGFVLETPHGKVYFAGDTAAGFHFQAIRERFGAMTLSLIPIGAYAPRWFMERVHIDPDEALQASLTLESQTTLAIHFATFNLADDAYDAPTHALARAVSHLADAPAGSDFRVLPFGEAAIVRLGEGQRGRGATPLRLTTATLSAGRGSTRPGAPNRGSRASPARRAARASTARRRPAASATPSPARARRRPRVRVPPCSQATFAWPRWRSVAAAKADWVPSTQVTSSGSSSDGDDGGDARLQPAARQPDGAGQVAAAVRGAGVHVQHARRRAGGQPARHVVDAQARRHGARLAPAQRHLGHRAGRAARRRPGREAARERMHRVSPSRRSQTPASSARTPSSSTSTAGASCARSVRSWRTISWSTATETLRGTCATRAGPGCAGRTP